MAILSEGGKEIHQNAASLDAMGRRILDAQTVGAGAMPRSAASRGPTMSIPARKPL